MNNKESVKQLLKEREILWVYSEKIKFIIKQIEEILIMKDCIIQKNKKFDYHFSDLLSIREDFKKESFQVKKLLLNLDEISTYKLGN